MAEKELEGLQMEVGGLLSQLKDEHLRDVCNFTGISGPHCCETAAKSHFALIKYIISYLNEKEELEDRGLSILVALKD